MPRSRLTFLTVLALWAVGLTGVLLTGCSGSNPLDTAKANKTLSYTPGTPNFDMEAVATVRHQTTGVDVYFGVPHLSLVFQPDSASYSAPYELTVQILSSDGNKLFAQESWQDTLRVDDAKQAETYQPFSFAKELDVKPGKYIVRAKLLDNNSGKQAVRLQRINVPELSNKQPALSAVRIEASKGSQKTRPVVALHVPANLDSLQAATDLYSPLPDGHLKVTAHLLRFRIDDTVADPPYWLTPMSSSLEYRGVDYGRVDTLETQTYTIKQPASHEQLTYKLPEMAPGIYRVVFSVQITDGPGGSEPVVRQQTRDISVKSPNFPRISDLEEVIEALAYIARDREIKKILAADTPKEQRRLFDAFWGARTSNKKEAANLLETYYSRVEEANLFFTTHKAGWKTDRGMLYVVLGAPVEVDHYVDQEIWYYSYADNDPRRIYVFEQGMHYDKRGMMFENFVLQRRPYYQRVWRRVVNHWRDGEPMM